MTIRRREKQIPTPNGGSTQRRKRVRGEEWAPIPEEAQLTKGTVTLEEYLEHPVRTL